MTVKDVAVLQKKSSERKSLGSFVIEGERACFDILRAKTLSNFINEIFVSESFIAEKRMQLEELTGALNLETRVVSDSNFDKMSDTKTPQGILFVMRMPVWDPDEVMKKGSFIMALDGVRDPGNMGTIIRTALAADADALLLSADCVDIYNPKVVRSTMSAVMKMPVITADDMAGFLHGKKAEGFKIYASAIDETASDYRAVSYSGSVVVIVGNEANGVSDELIALSDKKIYIPMSNGMESLNVSVAAGLLMYERVYTV